MFGWWLRSCLFCYTWRIQVCGRTASSGFLSLTVHSGLIPQTKIYSSITVIRLSARRKWRMSVVWTPIVWSGESEVKQLKRQNWNRLCSRVWRPSAVSDTSAATFFTFQRRANITWLHTAHMRRRTQGHECRSVTVTGGCAGNTSGRSSTLVIFCQVSVSLAALFQGCRLPLNGSAER